MNITIIGLGVIGGSLGLAIRENVPRAIVTGCDGKRQIGAALRKNAIDFGTESIAAAVHDADLIFLCTPVRAILDLIPSVASLCKKTAIITDVGSTKGEITGAARRSFRSRGIFVGGHPMAGSEGKGIDYADPLLFQNATYVLCASPAVKKKISTLTSLLHAIGSRVLFLTPSEHDKIASTVSHLPQLLAVALMNFVEHKNKRHQGYLQLAAGGFRDMTRIASSPYGMWNDILSSNASEIIKVIREFTTILTWFEKDLTDRSAEHRFRLRFQHAKKLRDAIPKNSKGFLHPLHELYISVDDRPGVLAVITTALYRKRINIKDIELLKIRDGRGGTFRISFESRRDAQRASVELKKKKITTLTQ